MSDSRPKVALCYQSYGPYHLARLKAAQQFVRGFDVVGVQIAARQSDYQWIQTGDDSVVTLEQDLPFNDVAPTGWQQRVDQTLEALNPSCCAVAGYSDPSMLAIIEWCHRHRCPIVLMSDSTAADARRTRWKEWLKSRIVSNCSAAFVAGTPHVAYLSQLGMPVNRIFLAYDVVDNDHFARGAAQALLEDGARRAKLNLPAHYFLASARFLEKKNLAALLRAYALYRNRRSGSITLPGNAPWQLVIIGDGALRGGLEDLRDNLGLASDVHMPGFKQYDDLPWYYGLAGAFVHVSTIEQWGLVVNEAMASRLPVLVSNRCGCATDLVQHGINGFTFDPYDIEAIADEMHRLSSMSRNEIDALGAASQNIIAKWGLERFAKGIESAANTAMQVGPKQPGIADRMILRALQTRETIGPAYWLRRRPVNFASSSVVRQNGDN